MKLIKAFLLILSILIISACKKETGPSGLNSLIKTSAVAAGTNCGNGGFKVETGLDINRNTILDADEVSNTTYICNGSNGNESVSLINVGIEAAGTNCKNGGYKIETGIDLNKNNVLEPTEVTKTTYVCADALSYTSVINQSGTQVPQENIVQNTLELTITWTRDAAGKYTGTFNKSVNLSKTIILTTNDRWVKCAFINDHQISLMNERGVNAFVDGVENYSLQIKSFN